jgi:hypothetical protein
VPDCATFGRRIIEIEHSLRWSKWAVDCNGRTIFVADAHRGDGKRFAVHADEKLTAFLELESATRTASDYSSESNNITDHPSSFALSS